MIEILHIVSVGVFWMFIGWLIGFKIGELRRKIKPWERKIDESLPLDHPYSRLTGGELIFLDPHEDLRRIHNIPEGEKILAPELFKVEDRVTMGDIIDYLVQTSLIRIEEKLKEKK